MKTCKPVVKERRGMTHHGRTARNVFAAVAVTLMMTVFSLAQYSETVPLTFTGGSGGAIGGNNLAADSAGNLYGTTFSGGNNSTNCGLETGVPGCGVVFQLIRHRDGIWEEKPLHTFTGGSDGAVPGGGVILDSAGNLYGTTLAGGDKKSSNCHPTGYVPGCGVVFKLAHGTWKETVLHTFTGGKDGFYPWAGLTFDQAGNLYGAAAGGGNPSGCNGVGCGVVFKLTPTAKGHWKESVLYAFGGGSAGIFPYGGVTFDSRGNLYGVTLYGGDTSVSCFGEPGCGLVYELTPRAHGLWKEKLLYAFKDGTDGAYPLFGVTLDSHGNVYGATGYGGDANCIYEGDPSGCGVVYELTPRAHGTWKEKVLYQFTGGSDGAFGDSPMIFDSAGNLYGIAVTGGDRNSPCTDQTGCGVVFKLTPPTNKLEKWNESVLYAFTGGTDGGTPQSNLLLDSAGNIFGMTEGGGNDSECTVNYFAGKGCGVVFELTP